MHLIKNILIWLILFIWSLFVLDLAWLIDINIPKFSFNKVDISWSATITKADFLSANTPTCNYPSIATLRDGIIVCASPDDIWQLDCVSPDGKIITEWEDIILYNTSCDQASFTCVDSSFVHDGTWSANYIEYRYASCISNLWSWSSCTYPNKTDNISYVIPDGATVLLYENGIVPKDGDCRYEVWICNNGKIKSSLWYWYPSCKHTNIYSLVYLQQNISNLIQESSSGLAIDPQYLEDTYTWSVTCERDGKVVPNGASVYAYQEDSVLFWESCSYELKVCRNGTFEIPNKWYTNISCEISNIWRDCTFSWWDTISHAKVKTFYSAYDTTTKSCESTDVVCWDGNFELPKDRFVYESCDSSNINKITQDDEVSKTNINLSDNQTWDTKDTNQPILCPNPYVWSYGAWQPGTRWVWYAVDSVPAWESCDYNKDGIPRKFDVVCQYGTIQPIWNTRKWYSSCTPQSNNTSCNTPWWTQVAHGDSVEAYFIDNVARGDSCQKQTRICDNGTLQWNFQYQNCTISQWNSCMTPWWDIIQHNTYVIAYRDNKVPSGNSCTSESRRCFDGKLEGSFINRWCEVSPPKSCINTPYGNIPHGWSVIRHTSSDPCIEYSLVCNDGRLVWDLLWHPEATQWWSCSW